MEPDQIQCKNCGELHDVGDNFCPHCGQKTNDELTLGVLFYNTISNYFSFDAKFIRSFLPLMFRPGFLAKQFILGKRLTYLHPGNMYLFISVIFFFVFSFTIAEWEKSVNEFNERIAKAPLEETISVNPNQLDSIQKAEIIKNLKENQGVLGLDDKAIETAETEILEQSDNPFSLDDFDKKRIDSMLSAGVSDDKIYKELGMSDNAGYLEKGFYRGALNLAKGSGAGNMLRRAFDAVPIAMFVLLPLFAFLLKLFYYKRGRYSYHLVFTFYFFSFLFTLFTILLALDRFVFPIPGSISTLIVLSTFFYFYVSLLHFYQRHWFTTMLKSGIITFIFSIFVFVVSTGIIFFGFING